MRVVAPPNGAASPFLPLDSGDGEPAAVAASSSSSYHAPLAPRRRCAPLSPPSASTALLSLGAGWLRVGTEYKWLWDCRGGSGGIGGGKRCYAKEMEVAVRVVQVACTLCHRVQDSLLLSDSGSGRVHSKLDRSSVTVAVWGVQAIVSWLLSDCFHDGSVSIVAEEDDQTLSTSDGAALLESVVAAVNGCLVEVPKYGLKSLEKELSAHDVLQALRKCSSTGGPKGRFTSPGVFTWRVWIEA